MLSFGGSKRLFSVSATKPLPVQKMPRNTQVFYTRLIHQALQLLHLILYSAYSTSCILANPLYVVFDSKHKILDTFYEGGGPK